MLRIRNEGHRSHRSNLLEVVRSTVLPPKEGSRRLRSKILVCLCAFLLTQSATSVQIDRVYEIQAANPPTLPEGVLSFLSGLTAPGLQSSGTFVYLRKSQTENKGAAYFFDSFPTDQFPHGSPTIFDCPDKDAKFEVATWAADLQTMYTLYKSPLDEGGVRLKVKLNVAQKPYTFVSSAESDRDTDSLLKAVFVSRDGKARHSKRYGGGPYDCMVSLNEVEQGALTFCSQDYQVADSVILFGVYPCYFERSGTVYFDDDTVTVGSGITDIKFPDTEFIYVREDISSSTACGSLACNTLVYTKQGSDTKQPFLVMMVLQPKQSPKAIIKFSSDPLDAEIDLSMFLQVKNTNKILVFAGTKTYIYKFTDSAFEKDASYVSTELPALIPGSLVVGKLDSRFTSTAVLMGLSGSGNTFQARMFLWEAKGCKSRSQDGLCTQCVQGYKLTGDSFDCEVDPNASSPGSSCSLTNCKTCTQGSSKCDECAEGFLTYLGQCIQCDKVTPAALIVEQDVVKCIKTDASPYLEGYREVQTSPFRVIEACIHSGCKKCPADKDVCTECKDPLRPPVNPLTNKPDCSPSTGSLPKDRIRRHIIRNTVDLLLDSPSGAKPAYSLRVIDLDNQKQYSCIQVGCSMAWQHQFLRLTFASDVLVARGLLVLTPTPTLTRLLQAAADRPIVVEDFQLLREGWFFSWTTVAQLLVWLLRLVGSVALFVRFPVAAVCADTLVTQAVVLALYLGPFLASVEVVLQVVAQVKVAWYWYANPFGGWDSHTLSCTARPNHAVHGLMCSFLDNYGQNVVGFAGLALVLGLAQWTARWLQIRGSAKVVAACKTIELHYGWRYLVARLDANQLEVMLYVLVSYSLADSSSKSVVGLVLATVMMLFYLAVAVGSTVLLVFARSATKADPVSPRTHTGPLHTEPDQPLASISPQTRLAGTTSTVRTTTLQNWQDHSAVQTIHRLAQHPLAYTLTNITPIHSWLQLCGPTLKLARTFAICILVLNHTQSAVAQLVIAIVLEAAYLGSRFMTRTEARWFEFYPSVAFQGLVVAYLVLKAISTNSHIPVANNQGGMSVVLSLLVLAMFLVVCWVQGTAATVAWTESGAATQHTEQTEVKQNKPVQTGPARKNTKLELIEEGLAQPQGSTPLPISQQHIMMDLDIPDEVRDPRGHSAHSGVFGPSKRADHMVSQPRATAMGYGATGQL